MPKKQRTQQERISEGKAAENLPKVVTDSMKQIEEDLTNSWKAENDPSKREQHWAQIKSLEMIQDELGRLINDGKIAKKQKERGE
tara:strand:- start:74 stop:328 length:255 start_codon:yes stop_codon:yes gene_type:complete